MKKATRALSTAALLLVGLSLSGCSSDPTFPPVFDPSLGIDLASMTKTASGLYYQDLVLGTGATAVAGDHVNVRYTGWLSSGEQFDSGDYHFVLGNREAIDGFDEGVTGMNVGGKRKLVLPPELGYGKNGQGPIPGNATLVFEVELLEIL
jgi:FKBP-type peptidyl-prolyl cis-trans isomerase FkpA